MHRIAETLARLLAPILVHTTEEVWSYLKLPNKPESVHLADMPAPAPSDRALLERWAPLIEARDAVKKAIEEARQSGRIGNPLEARVTLPASYRPLETFGGGLPALFLVSQVVFGDAESIDVGPADGVKCARCWLIKTDVGAVAAHPDLCARCAAAIADPAP
jgi:isoleucyl-tRNA synthetase